MDLDNCLDHTYCRSPEDKFACEYTQNSSSSFDDDCSDESFSLVHSAEEESENRNRTESLQSMRLEELRLASDEKRNGQSICNDDDLIDEVKFTRNRNSDGVTEFKTENTPSSIVPIPIQISKDPKLSAFVPWKRTKTVANLPSSNKRDEISMCEQDEISLFGDYVASEIRSMKDKYHQTLVKKKIQDAIFEVQMMWLKECNIKMNNGFSSQ